LWAAEAITSNGRIAMTPRAETSPYRMPHSVRKNTMTVGTILAAREAKKRA
jgi:hypothetical protein